MRKLSRRPIVVLTSLLLVLSLVFGANSVLASGKLDWGSNGVLVKKDTGMPFGESALQIKSDGQGNVFIIWTEKTLEHSKLFAQKYTTQGKPIWQQPIQITQFDVALPFIGYPGNSNSSVLTNDGGIIVVWTDNRYNRQPDIFAQKINADGSIAWIKDGAPVYVGPGFQQVTSIISDNEGGAEIIWVDQERPGLYMQRIGPDGKTLWQEGGISLDTITGVESKNSFFGIPYNGYDPNGFAAQTDNQGGFYLTWSDMPRYYEYDIPLAETTPTYSYVQKVDKNGQKEWQQAVSIKQPQPQYGFPQGLVTTADGCLVISRFVEDISKQPKPGPRGFDAPYQPIYQAFAWKISVDGKLLWGGAKPFFTTPKGSWPDSPMLTVASGNGIINVIGISQYPGRNKAHMTSIDALGTIAWHKQIDNNQSYGPTIAQSDGKDGVFIASTIQPDKQSALRPYVSIQRFSKDGKALWQGKGIKFITGMNGIYNSRLEPDGSGGMFIGWFSEKQLDPKKYVNKREYLEQEQSDIYIQHIRDDGSGFPDLSADDWSYPFIDGLVKAGAIKGYNDGSFKPNGYITRAEFAKLAVIALGYDKLDVDSAEGIFDHFDRNEIGKSWAKDYIYKAIKAGLIKGYYSPRKTVYADRFRPGPIPDRAFRPNARVTRAEVAAIIFRAKNLQSAAITQQFTDVPKSHWAFQYIDGLRQLGIAAGYGDNEFRPMNVISRKETAKMIFKVMPGTQQ